MKKESAIKKLEKHLKQGKSVTGLQALNWWRLYRLSDAIHKLRRKGLNIKTTMVKRGNKEYARYEAL